MSAQHNIILDALHSSEFTPRYASPRLANTGGAASTFTSWKLPARIHHPPRCSSHPHRIIDLPTLSRVRERCGGSFVTGRGVTCRMGFSAYREGRNIDRVARARAELPFRRGRCNGSCTRPGQVDGGVGIKLRIIGKRECGLASKRRVGRKGARRTYYLGRGSIERTETKGATEQNNANVQGTRN